MSLGMKLIIQKGCIRRGSEPTQKVETPVLLPAGSITPTFQWVTIECSTPWARIYYTTDGKTPTINSTQYTGDIYVDVTTTIKAKAYLEGMIPSDVATGYYEVTGTVSTPVMSVAPGTYAATQSVELSCATSGADIRYTTDGSNPSSSSALYDSALTISEGTTLKAIAYKQGWTPSDVVSATYNIATFAFTEGTDGVVSTLRITATASITCSGGISWRIGSSGDFVTTPLSVNGAVEIQILRTSSQTGYIFTPINSVTRVGLGDYSSGTGYLYSSGGSESRMPHLTVNLSHFSRSSFTLISFYISSQTVKIYLTGELNTCSAIFISGDNVYWNVNGNFSTNILSCRVYSNNVVVNYSGELQLSAGLVFRGSQIHRPISGFTGTANNTTLQLLKWRTDKATDAEVIFLLSSLRLKTGSVASTVIINDYKAAGSVPQHVIDEANLLIAAGKGVTTVTFGA